MRAEVGIAKVGRYSGTSTSYQSIVSWTVTSTKSGELIEVSLTSDNFAKTQFKVEIGGGVIDTDIALGEALTLPFGKLKISGSTKVELFAKSTDGTAINADGSISGLELGDA